MKASRCPAFARRYAEKTYGFTTHDGTLEQHVGDLQLAVSNSTMVDLIEHVSIRDVPARRRGLPRAGWMRRHQDAQPDCPEARSLRRYHSLKREHLILLTPASLTAAADLAGTDADELPSPTCCAASPETTRFANGLRLGWGADIVAWYRLSG